MDPDQLDLLRPSSMYLQVEGARGRSCSRTWRPATSVKRAAGSPEGGLLVFLIATILRAVEASTARVFFALF